MILYKCVCVTLRNKEEAKVTEREGNFKFTGIYFYLLVSNLIIVKTNIGCAHTLFVVIVLCALGYFCANRMMG